MESVWQSDISQRASTVAGHRGASGRPVRGRVEPESRVPTETVITQCKFDLSANFIFIASFMQEMWLKVL